MKVGSVDFLEQPTIAFVRLAEGCLMPSITEVPIPVRFLFILLGPKTADLDYHEVGRSIATLMSNRHFHNIAYKADDRRELLSAINEFLDDSIVLPPGKRPIFRQKQVIAIAKICCHFFRQFIQQSHLSRKVGPRTASPLRRTQS